MLDKTNSCINKCRNKVEENGEREREMCTVEISASF